MISHILKSSTAALRTRQRGYLLLEVVLGLGVIGSAALVLYGEMQSSSERTANAAAADQLARLGDAASAYVFAEYDDLRGTLAGAATAGSPALQTITLDTVSNAGYLDAGFLNNAAATTAMNRFDQTFGVLLRAVDIADTNDPRATLVQADLADADADGNGVPDILEDGDIGNGEMAVEAVLVTSGGDRVWDNRGFPIAVLAGGRAGYVQTVGAATGANGAWTMDLTPFAASALYPAAGRFAVPIAWAEEYTLADNGTVDVASLFSRIDVARENTIQTDIEFEATDSDNNGQDDNFPTIVNVFGLEMADPVDTDNDGVPDIVAFISNVREIECPNGDGATNTGTSLLIDCPEVTVAGNLTADNLQLTSIGNQDIAEGIFNAGSFASGDVIPKPTCGANANGVALTPTIHAELSGFADVDGRALVGSFVQATDNGASWTVRIYAWVDEDVFVNNANNPPGTPNASGDGISDLHEVTGDLGAVTVSTQCAV